MVEQALIDQSIPLPQKSLSERQCIAINHRWRVQYDIVQISRQTFERTSLTRISSAMEI